MHTDSVKPFLDNWAYLKIELVWLDRVLGLAIAQQRKDAKEVDRIAHTRADRVTSHWWKGLVSLEGGIASDSPAAAPQRKSSSGASFQQQMEAKIQASHQQGVLLGLPFLCARLNLSGFEKNLVLMALAPEINRRYGRIYNYLQETEHSGATGLPTVDLILRILCRTDTDWRSGRHYLTTSTLIQHGLLAVEPAHTDSLLNRLVKLSDPLVSFLLADQPDGTALEDLLTISDARPPLTSTTQTPPNLHLNCWTPAAIAPQTSINQWSNLVLPAPLIAALQHLCHRIQFADQVDQALSWQQTNSWQQTDTIPHSPTGSIVLLVGAAGTGKTTAAQTIAQTLQTPLVWADLALLNPTEQKRLMQMIQEQAPTVLLLQSAQVWLGRSAALEETEIRRFLTLRQNSSGITLFTVQQKQAIRPHWQRQLTQLEFPVPDTSSRLQLWQQAFLDGAPLDQEIDWKGLAQQFKLTGGEIAAIAREAAIYAAAADTTIQLEHLIQACKMFKRKLG